MGREDKKQPAKKGASKTVAVKKQAENRAENGVDQPALKPGKISKLSGLNPNHLRFVKEYARCGFNGARAYRIVYGVTNGDVSANAASRLLGNVGVQTLLREHCEKIAQKFDITQENIMAEMAKLAGFNFADFLVVQENGTLAYDFSDMTREQAAAISELTIDEIVEADPDGKRGDLRTVRRTKIKLSDKLKALITLGNWIRIAETLPTVSKKKAELLGKVQDGTLSVREAAYEFEIAGLPIPDVIEIELAKTEIEPPDTGEGITAEELNRRFIEACENADREKNMFLPNRKQEVADLKKEFGEGSFGPLEDREEKEE